MAFKLKRVVLVTAILQIIMFVIYLAFADHFDWYTRARYNFKFSYDTFKYNFTQHDSKSNVPAASVFSAIVQKVTSINVESFQPPIENVEQRQPAENTGSNESDKQRQLSMNTAKDRQPETISRKTTAVDTGDEHKESADRVGGSNIPVTSDLQKRLTSNSTSLGLQTSDVRTPEVFQTVDLKESWLYSAFYDYMAAERGKPLVRVFGIVRGEWRRTVYCNFSSEDGNVSSTGSFTTLPDSHRKNYLPCYLECSLPSNVRPTHVSVSYQTQQKPTNRLQIIYPGPRIRNFTVCYSVLHSGYSKTFHLIDSIELHRLLGAEHFVVYNHSISLQLSQVLRGYQDDGLVTVLQWALPTDKSWYFAQMTALNDCFYRNRNISRFVVVVDTDEVIVPTYHYSWMDLISSVSPHEADLSNSSKLSEQGTNLSNLTGCFLFRSCYFTIYSTPNWNSLPPQFQFTEDEKKNLIKYNILSLSQFVRSDSPFSHTKRSKYIARPEFVDASGIHFVENFTNPMTCLNVNENMALIHHYRKPNLRRHIVRDTSTLKYKSILYSRVMKQIHRFF